MNKRTMLKFLFVFVILNNYQISYSSECPNVIAVKKNKYLYDFILNQDGTPTQALLDILEATKVEHNGTLSNIVKLTQEKWIRKPSTERWQMEEIDGLDKNAMLEKLNKINSVKEVAPQEEHYDYVLLLGAAAPRVKSRLDYLLELWNEGISFDKVVLLGSDRVLDSKIESEEIILELCPNTNNRKLPKNEIELLNYMYSNLPEDFKKSVQLELVESKGTKNADGTVKRATTGDTIIDWLKNSPVEGSCLAISNAPFTGYQDSVLRTFLPKEFSLETAGHKAGEITVAVYLDNLARWLYQEQIRRK
ncbi:MAG: hypothetical protein P4L22_06640 [Candidatus Babeliales bacterium]|nr:hypothetical protein [Candidatus Babeliales bacterium]